MIARVCKQLSLKTALKVVYAGSDGERSDGEPDVMTNKIARLEDVGDNDLSYALTKWYGGVELKALGKSGTFVDVNDTVEKRRHSDSKSIEVYWVTKMTKITTLKQPYMAYGNEASMWHTYGHVCLVVHLGPVRIEGGKCVRG